MHSTVTAMVRIHVVMLQHWDISGYDTDVTVMATDTAVTAVTTGSAVSVVAADTAVTAMFTLV